MDHLLHYSSNLTGGFRWWWMVLCIVLGGEEICYSISGVTREGAID